ncbi:MAG: decaprenyl-phosphate phosphoribosyltransferase [Anaerolineales bacterium]|nr:decaprenyl-phosphate phosphoribosyltransferase [Anaerolineales bacterium]MCX7608217.1 decaprenyl-phosphate phosphoribosyltransferase [Anaerolineales bacterium]MDW8227038.1 decaprenyl-phosphate phosphoribosyltransferase [Anaerolineales bacterium]
MLRDLLKTMRPRQWTKNIFVFAALVFDGKLFHLTDFLHTLGSFVLFCLASSAVYLLNDIFDIEVDRQHPLKKNRPIASGRLPIPPAAAVAFLLAGGSIAAAYFLAWQLALTLLLYFALMLAYSRWLKHIPIVDVLIIAAGFVLRVHAGTTVVAVERFSPWLYVLMTLLALYLGFGKRRAELALLAGDAVSHRKVLDGYTIPLLDQFITIVSGTTIVAYSLYTFFRPEAPENHTLMLTIPFVVYAIFRYLYLIQVKQIGGEPEEILLTDRPFQLSLLLWGLTVLAVFYLPS